MRRILFQVPILTSLLLFGLGVEGVAAQDSRCDPGNGGLELPPGFCAVVVAGSKVQAASHRISQGGYWQVKQLTLPRVTVHTGAHDTNRQWQHRFRRG